MKIGNSLNKNVGFIAMLALYGSNALAAGNTDSTSFAVKLEITATCSVSAVPASDINFGSHASNEGAQTSQGALTVNCTNGTSYQIGLDNGINFSGSRRMKGQDNTNHGDYVPYSLYKDSATSLAWGNTIGTDTLTGTGSGTDDSLVVYAKLADLNFKAGHYQDTVTATVTY